MIALADTPFPYVHANQRAQSVTNLSGFPENQDQVGVTTALLPSSQILGAYVFQNRFYTMVDLFPENHISMIEWSSQSPKEVCRIIPGTHFDGWIVIVQNLQTREEMIIGANRKTARVEQLDPESLETCRCSDWTFLGTPRGINFFRGFGGQPVMYITCSVDEDSDRGDTTTPSQVYFFNPFEGSFPQIAEPHYFAQGLGSRVGTEEIDGEDKLFMVSGKNMVVRARFDGSMLVPDKSPSEPTENLQDENNDEVRRSWRYIYDGWKSGTTPTIVDSRVVFMNNGYPSIRHETYLFSLDKRDFLAPEYCVAPFPKRNRQPSAFTQSSPMAFSRGEGLGGSVFPHSYKPHKAEDSNDTTFGLSRVDVHPDGSLRHIWRDPYGGERRTGLVAPNDGNGRVFTLFRDLTNLNTEYLRALDIEDYQRDGDPAHAAPREVWRVEIKGHGIMRGVSVAQQGVLLAGSSAGLHFIYNKALYPDG